MGRRRRAPESPSIAYQLVSVLEALARIARIVAIVTVAGLTLASPLIALYEYDQQNEPTPNLTPDDLLDYATWIVPSIVSLATLAFLGPWLRRKKLELTPGIAEIDRMQRSSRRDRKLLGDTSLAPRKGLHRDVDGILAGTPDPDSGKFGKIITHRSRGGRRLGIVYRDAAQPAPTLRRKKKGRHQRKRGPKTGKWHTLRRALGFSRQGRDRPSWWRAWLRLS